MSHIVCLQTKVHDTVAIAAACHRLNLAAPVQGKAALFAREVTGLLVSLPGWQYPAVIDTGAGTIQFDIYEGKWGNPGELDRLLQAYAVEKTKLEARKKGHSISEQLLQDGSIRVQIATV